jgi:hypothetical protein
MFARLFTPLQTMAVNMLMYARSSLEKDIPSIIGIINSYETMYGIDLTASGLRDKHIQSVSDHTPPTETDQIIVAVDKEENILGLCFQRFTPRSWILSYCYIRQLEDKNQYNASKIGGLMLDKLCESAEERGITKFYYAVRDSGNKRLAMTLTATDMVNQRYEFSDIERLPPMTKTTNELTAKHILSSTNGLNKKPIIIRCGYLK